MFELPNKEEHKDDIIEEKWMIIIARYPNGNSYPIRFFKLGADYKKTKKELPKQKMLISEKEETQEL